MRFRLLLSTALCCVSACGDGPLGELIAPDAGGVDAGPQADVGPQGSDAGPTDFSIVDGGLPRETYCATSTGAAAIQTTIFGDGALSDWAWNDDSVAAATPDGFVLAVPSAEGPLLRTSDGLALEADWSRRVVSGEWSQIGLAAVNSELHLTDVILGEPPQVRTRRLGLDGTVLSTSAFTLPPLASYTGADFASHRGEPWAILHSGAQLSLRAADVDLPLSVPGLSSESIYSAELLPAPGLFSLALASEEGSPKALVRFDFDTKTPGSVWVDSCHEGPATRFLPSVARHPDGILVARRCTGGTRLELLSDAELTPIRTIELGGAPFRMMPQVTMDAGGAVLVIWIEADGSLQLRYLRRNLTEIRALSFVPTNFSRLVRAVLSASATVPGSLAVFLHGVGGHGSGPVGVTRVELCE